MANSKISALTSATTPLAGTETLPIVQNSTTKQVSIENVTAGRTVNVKYLAVNTTLKTWYANSVPIQFGIGGVLEARDNYTPYSAWATNSYIDVSGNDIYIAAGEATRLEQNVGLFRWKTAPSGAAGAACTFTTRMELAQATGDLSLKTGNLVQGTAAKGVNFTANTPAAGMTSQLLNWYEEGTWTPGFAAWATAPTSSAGKYVRIGSQVTVIVLGQSGINAGAQAITGLPFANSNAVCPTGALKVFGASTLSSLCNIDNNATSINSFSTVTLTGNYWSLSITYFVTF